MLIDSVIIAVDRIFITLLRSFQMLNLLASRKIKTQKTLTKLLVIIKVLTPDNANYNGVDGR
jgi:hypothetical protein